MADLFDRFTGTAGLLTGHTADSGDTWGPTGYLGASLDGSGNVYGNSDFATHPWYLGHFAVSSWTPPSADYAVKIVLGAQGTDNPCPAARCSGVAGALSGYVISCGGNSATIFRFNVGSFTTLFSGAFNVAHTMTAGDVIEIRVAGSLPVVIDLYINGVHQATYSDSSGSAITGMGSAGFVPDQSDKTATPAQVTTLWAGAIGGPSAGVTPATATVALGGTQGFTATGVLPNEVVNWTSTHGSDSPTSGSTTTYTAPGSGGTDDATWTSADIPTHAASATILLTQTRTLASAPVTIGATSPSEIVPPGGYGPALVTVTAIPLGVVFGAGLALPRAAVSIAATAPSAAPGGTVSAALPAALVAVGATPVEVVEGTRVLLGTVTVGVAAAPLPLVLTGGPSVALGKPAVTVSGSGAPCHATGTVRLTLARATASAAVKLTAARGTGAAQRLLAQARVFPRVADLVPRTGTVTVVLGRAGVVARPANLPVANLFSVAHAGVLVAGIDASLALTGTQTAPVSRAGVLVLTPGAPAHGTGTASVALGMTVAGITASLTGFAATGTSSRVLGHAGALPEAGDLPWHKGTLAVSLDQAGVLAGVQRPAIVNIFPVTLVQAAVVAGAARPTPVVSGAATGVLARGRIAIEVVTLDPPLPIDWLSALIQYWKNTDGVQTLSPELYYAEAPPGAVWLTGPNQAATGGYYPVVVISQTAGRTDGLNTGSGYWDDEYYTITAYHPDADQAKADAVAARDNIDPILRSPLTFQDGYQMSVYRTVGMFRKVPGSGPFSNTYVHGQAYDYRVRVGHLRAVPNGFAGGAPAPPPMSTLLIDGSHYLLIDGAGHKLRLS